MLKYYTPGEIEHAKVLIYKMVKFMNYFALDDILVIQRDQTEHNSFPSDPEDGLYNKITIMGACMWQKM